MLTLTGEQGLGDDSDCGDRLIGWAEINKMIGNNDSSNMSFDALSPRKDMHNCTDSIMIQDRQKHALHQ